MAPPNTSGYKRTRVNLKALEKFLNGLPVNEDLMLDINTQFAWRCEPYVPYKTGRLSKANITKTGVSYNAPYAHYQYVGIVYGPNYPRYASSDPNTIVGWFSPPGQPKYPTGRDLVYDTSVHPMAGPEWDKRMMAAEGDEFTADCQELINRRVTKFNAIHSSNW